MTYFILIPIIILVSIPTLLLANKEESLLSSLIQKQAVPISKSYQLPESTIKKIKKHKVIGLGEMHGNYETPEMFGSMVKQLNDGNQKIIVGLEFPVETQPHLNAFLKNKDIKSLAKLEFFKREYQDGRSSTAMVELLKTLAELSSKVEVIAFDPASKNYTDGNERDLKMARNLIKAYKTSKNGILMVLTGNLHSSLKAGNQFNPEHRSAFYNLSTLPKTPFSSNDILPIYVRYSKGSSWMCFSERSRDCRTRTFDNKTPYSSANKEDIYFFEEPQLTKDGHKASIFIRQVSASLPIKI